MEGLFLISPSVYSNIYLKYTIPLRTLLRWTLNSDITMAPLHTLIYSQHVDMTKYYMFWRQLVKYAESGKDKHIKDLVATAKQILFFDIYIGDFHFQLVWLYWHTAPTKVHGQSFHLITENHASIKCRVSSIHHLECAGQFCGLIRGNCHPSPSC